MGRGEGIAGRVAHLDAGSSDGEERETGDSSGAGDAAERAVRAVMRDPEVVCSSAAARGSTGRSERSDSGRAERRGGARDDGHGRARANARRRARRASSPSRAARTRGGQGRFPRRRLRTSGTRCHRATWRRALERGGKDAYLRRGAACARCVITPWLAVDFGCRGATAYGARDRAASPQLQHLKGCFIFLLSEGRVGEQASERPACKIFAHISVINFCT